KEIAAKGSRIAKAADRQQSDATKATGAGAGGQVAPAAVPDPLSLESLGQKATGFKGIFEGLEAFAMFAWSKFPWIAGGVAAYFFARMAYDAWVIKQARVEDANEGWSPVVTDVPEEAADGVL